jgi:membrane fusion protein (multidrug efflux system)
VQPGGLAAADFLIAEGQQGGAQVIVNGLQKARPGSVVKPVPLGGAMPADAAPANKQ